MFSENLYDDYRNMLSKLVGSIIEDEEDAEELFSEIYSSKKYKSLK